MKGILQFRRSATVLWIIASLFIAFTKCVNQENEKMAAGRQAEEGVKEKIPTVSYQQFAGSATCAGCHKDVYESHLRTAHYNTSHPALEKYIKGSFLKGKNIYQYNPALAVAMEKRDSGLYQVVYYQGEEKMVLPFDMVIGSGAKGQSFAYWKDNWLFQMPITYFTA
ncbi:MAG TPA: hypothetical protein VEV15_06015, partial [Flavisolibacter sp.]|nr:hypothetical protein [Flavisolibacter sp.]